MRKIEIFIFIIVFLIPTLVLSNTGIKTDNTKDSKDALEKTYKKCMSYSRHKPRCSKYKELRSQIKTLSSMYSSDM